MHMITNLRCNLNTNLGSRGETLNHCQRFNGYTHHRIVPASREKVLTGCDPLKNCWRAQEGDLQPGIYYKHYLGAWPSSMKELVGFSSPAFFFNLPILMKLVVNSGALLVKRLFKRSWVRFDVFLRLLFRGHLKIALGFVFEITPNNCHTFKVKRCAKLRPSDDNIYLISSIRLRPTKIHRTSHTYNDFKS